MITIDINKPIGPEEENRWMAMWGEDEVVFSLESIKRMFEENASETDFKFNFNCDGGYVEEGLAIYDYIRTSGKNIYCNIEGGCHSMAIVLLLAAPKNQRTANKHATSLIHCIRAQFCGSTTADELREMAMSMDELEEKVLNIYADRTGGDKEELRTLMHEEKMRDTDFMLEHGFIDRINPYTTNSRMGMGKNNITNIKNAQNMASIKEALEMAHNWLTKAKDSFEETPEHKDAEGTEVHEEVVNENIVEEQATETENEGVLNEDGEGVKEEETQAEEATQVEEKKEDEELVNLRNQVKELTSQKEELESQAQEMKGKIEEMQNALNEGMKTMEELKAQVASNYKPKNARRTAPVAAAENKQETAEEHRQAQRERLGIIK